MKSLCGFIASLGEKLYFCAKIFNRKEYMRKTIVTLYLSLWAVWAVAQPRFTSNTEEYRFGQVEWKHPVTAQYDITNTGDQPLVLTGVEPDCACTATQWTRTPIAPGEKGMVSVTFDAEALGHFNKWVAVSTNTDPELVYLRLTGQVVRKITDFTHSHPYLIGQIRIDREELDFPDVHHGEHPVMRLGVANLSGQPYEPVLMHLPSYLEAKAEPAVLQEGEQGVISLTLLSEKLADLGLTQSSVYLSRFAGDKVGEDNELPVSVVLLPDFSALTAAEKAAAPSIGLSAQRLDLSEALARKSKARQDIVVTNNGRSPLVISKLQVFHPAVSVRMKKNVLQPGESAALRITVHKKHIGKRRRPLRLLMITNDPAQPKVTIEIKH